MTSESEELGFGPWAILALLLWLIPLGGFVIAAQFSDYVGAIGIAGLIYLSAATVGALLGFIFAVPRVVAKAQGPTQGEGSDNKVLSTNTNLERISDWLTTMLVGVGLSQLHNLNGVMLQFRRFLEETARVYENGTSAGVLPAVGPFILILGAASGFLFMYLLTRLVLVSFFAKSEDALSSRAVAAVRVAVRQAQADHAQSAPATERVASGSRGRSTRDAALAAAPAPASFTKASEAPTLNADDALEVMFDLLYEPGGYKRVIQMSAELSRTPITRRADYWFYLAAAWGQEMHHSEEGTDTHLSARDNAIDSATRAVKIDKSYRSRLREISNPNSTDNDLALLRDDPAFLAIIGRP